MATQVNQNERGAQENLKRVRQGVREEEGKEGGEVERGK